MGASGQVARAVPSVRAHQFHGRRATPQPRLQDRGHRDLVVPPGGRAVQVHPDPSCQRLARQQGLYAAPDCVGGDHSRAPCRPSRTSPVVEEPAARTEPSKSAKAGLSASAKPGLAGAPRVVPVKAVVKTVGKAAAVPARSAVPAKAVAPLKARGQTRRGKPSGGKGQAPGHQAWPGRVGRQGARTVGRASKGRAGEDSAGEDRAGQSPHRSRSWLGPSPRWLPSRCRKPSPSRKPSPWRRWSLRHRPRPRLSRPRSRPRPRARELRSGKPSRRPRPWPGRPASASKACPHSASRATDGATRAPTCSMPPTGARVPISLTCCTGFVRLLTSRSAAPPLTRTRFGPSKSSIRTSSSTGIGSSRPSHRRRRRPATRGKPGPPGGPSGGRAGTAGARRLARPSPAAVPPPSTGDRSKAELETPPTVATPAEPELTPPAIPEPSAEIVPEAPVGAEPLPSPARRFVRVFDAPAEPLRRRASCD